MAKTHLYYGNGKGKTTAALGLALRTLGYKKKVVFIQFMKKGEFGEIKALRKFPQVIVKQFGRKGFVSKVNNVDRKLAQAGLKFAEQALRKKPALLVLDELNTAVNFKLLSREEVFGLLDQKLFETEIIITGRGNSQWLRRKADLITEMREVKHYFKKGIKARPGVEF